MSDDPKQRDLASSDEKPKTRRELPVFAVQDDDAMMAEEMADLFEEDKVNHQHGSSEPEAD